MRTLIKSGAAAAGVALWAVIAATEPAVVHATPSSTLTSQDSDSGKDGALIDADGTMGDYKTAMDGTLSGPLMDAVPQYRAGQK